MFVVPNIPRKKWVWSASLFPSASLLHVLEFMSTCFFSRSAMPSVIISISNSLSDLASMCGSCCLASMNLCVEYWTEWRRNTTYLIRLSDSSEGLPTNSLAGCFHHQLCLFLSKDGFALHSPKMLNIWCYQHVKHHMCITVRKSWLRTAISAPLLLLNFTGSLSNLCSIQSKLSIHTTKHPSVFKMFFFCVFQCVCWDVMHQRGKLTLYLIK